jgi:glutathione S-transferase
VPTVQVDLRADEQFSPAFRAVNPGLHRPGARARRRDLHRRRHGDLRLLRGIAAGAAADGRRRAGSGDRDGVAAPRRNATASSRSRKRSAIPRRPSKGAPCPDAMITSRYPRWSSAGAPASGRFFAMLDVRLADHEFIAGTAIHDCRHHRPSWPSTSHAGSSSPYPRNAAICADGTARCRRGPARRRERPRRQGAQAGGNDFDTANRSRPLRCIATASNQKR